MTNTNDAPQYDAHVKLHEVVMDKLAVEREWIEMEDARDGDLPSWSDMEDDHAEILYDEYEAAVLGGFGDDEHLSQEDF